jgi:hypothetical protein
MRKLALVLSAFGFIAYSGIAHADDKAENTEKTDVSHTLTGKKKITKTKKSVSPDGTTTEMKSETTLPKSDEQGVRRDDNNSGSNEANEKVESKTTLGGKRQIKSTKEFKGADGRESESTRTTTSPDNNRTPDTNK